jgi:hypothetical protein
MMVVVVMVMVSPRGEHGAGKRHHQQGSGKNLFHDQNLAREWRKLKVDWPLCIKRRNGHFRGCPASTPVGKETEISVS